MLVVFPLAFFCGAFVFDLAGLFCEESVFHAFAYYLCCAGAVMAVVAAVPGVIDYIKVIPPRSSASRRATTHALLNCTVLLTFVAVIFLRRKGFGPFILVSEFIATVLMIVASWQGGTLVHRNQIGIDHRYAAAGKWKEAWFLNARLPLEVTGSDQLKAGQMMLLHVNGKRIVLANTGSGYAAFDDRCPHRGGSLAAGVMMCGQVQCPWHGSQFDAKTGACMAGPATSGIPVYEVKEENGKVILLNLN
jgi:nitrite reductase/ring-hydroxylating ferredoxin subunit/uncharacterized membrane protein